MKPITLPEEPAMILSGKADALHVFESLHAAHWLAGRNDHSALYLLKSAHASLAALAEAMGYTLTPKEITEAQEAAE